MIWSEFPIITETLDLDTTLPTVRIHLIRSGMILMILPSLKSRKSLLLQKQLISSFITEKNEQSNEKKKKKYFFSIQFKFFKKIIFILVFYT